MAAEMTSEKLAPRRAPRKTTPKTSDDMVKEAMTAVGMRSARALVVAHLWLVKNRWTGREAQAQTRSSSTPSAQEKKLITQGVSSV